MPTTADGLPPNYRFADLTLDVARRAVLRDGQPIELKSLDFALLRFLVESAPDVVNADVLAEKVWGRHFVSPENVAQRVMLLRQSLSDDAARPRYIETVRNKGYRLVPVVERAPAQGILNTPQHRSRAVQIAGGLLTLVVAASLVFWLSQPDGRTTLAPRSVGVLPFENLSPGKEQEFFATGMQDEIVMQLTKINGLRVFPVRPAVDERGGPRALNVATSLGGSVYYSEGRVRVTPRLTEIATGASLWSHSYEGELSNIFELQSEIALDIAFALSLKLSRAERQRIERVPTIDAKARDLYLRARARTWRETADEMRTSIEELERAVELDAAFTEAWVANANAHTTAQYYDPGHASEHRARAVYAARRALELDAERGDAHAALGYALSTLKDWKGAEAAYRKARSLNATLAEVGPYAILQLSVGNFALARDILEERRAAEPGDATTHRFLVFANAALGEWATATALYESGLRLFVPWREGPNQRMHWLVGRQELAEVRATPVDDPLNASMLANLYSPNTALSELRRAHAAEGAPNRRRDIGLWAAHFGDAEIALASMRAAIDEQGGQMVYMWLPQLAPVRRLPEFKAYLREIGMVEYWQEYGWPTVCRPLSKGDFECD